jgi:hypothetical protein
MSLFITPSEHCRPAPGIVGHVTHVRNLTDGYVCWRWRGWRQLMLMLVTINAVGHTELLLELLDLATLISGREIYCILFVRVAFVRDRHLSFY